MLFRMVELLAVAVVFSVSSLRGCGAERMRCVALRQSHTPLLFLALHFEDVESSPLYRRRLLKLLRTRVLRVGASVGSDVGHEPFVS